MDLTIDTTTADDGRWLLRLAGALDLESRTHLLQISRDAVVTPGCTAIVINLAGVTFLDSTGIGALVQIAGDAADAGLGFALQAPSARVMRILEITGLDRTWPIEDDSAA